MGEADEPTIGRLFRHALRPAWGLAVLSHEGDGKRHYLFEDGSRRALARDFDSLMTPIEKPTPEQHAAYARLQKLVGARSSQRPSEGAGAEAEEFEAQLARLRGTFPAGLSDPKWVVDFRASALGVSPGRDAAIESARARLGTETLDALLSARRFEEVWALASSLGRESGLLLSSFKGRRVPSGEPLHELAVALRGLLSDEGPYGARFDRYVQALTLAFGKAPSWELATLASALIFPSDHVYVEPKNFRRLIKATRARRALPATPSGATYAMLLGLARSLARKLAEHGEAPRDLLDVRDFMCVTLAPARGVEPRADASKSVK